MTPEHTIRHTSPAHEADPAFAKFNAKFGPYVGNDNISSYLAVPKFRYVKSTSLFQPGVLQSQTLANPTASRKGSIEVLDNKELPTIKSLEVILRDNDNDNPSEGIVLLGSWLDAVAARGYTIDIHRILRYAVHKGCLAIVKYLITDREADLKRIDTDGRSAIFFAAACSEITMLDYVFQELGALDVTRLDDGGAAPLYYAQGISQAEYLILKCTPPNEQALLARSTLDLLVQKRPHFLEEPDEICNCLFLHGWLNASLQMPIRIEVRVPGSGSPDDGIWRTPWCNLRHLLCETESLRQQLIECCAKTDKVNRPAIHIHVPWTNGIILRRLIHVIKQWTRLNNATTPWRESRYDSVGSFDSWFMTSFNQPSVPAGDRSLNYLTTGFTVTDEDRTALVFPCLELVSSYNFGEARTAHTSLRERIDIRYSSFANLIQTPRTLDETHFPSLGTTFLEELNDDQVVSREFQEIPGDGEAYGAAKPLLVVSQMWVWKHGDYVLSAYSNPGQAPDDHASSGVDFPVDFVPLNYAELQVLRKRELDMKLSYGRGRSDLKINLLLRESIHSFGKAQARGTYLVPLDYFEMGVGRILSSMARYTKDMTADSLDVEKERDFVHHMSDLGVELGAIDEVLLEQEEIAAQFRHQVLARYPDAAGVLSGNTERINLYRRRIAKIKGTADHVDQAISRALVLKRTHASIQDARASLLLGWAVLGFTIVTILFAPIAFMASLLALPVDSWSMYNGTDATGATRAAYRSGYIAWTFLLAELVTIMVTLGAVATAVKYQGVLFELFQSKSPDGASIQSEGVRNFRSLNSRGSTGLDIELEATSRVAQSQNTRQARKVLNGSVENV